MVKKFKTTIFLLLFFISTFFTIQYYFSEEHIVHVNKSRLTYTLTSFNELPLLKNDTNNIINYKDDLEIFKKKRKKRFWEKLITDDK